MQLVKHWHPDLYADDPRMLEVAQEKLKIINSAYAEVKAAIAARDARARQGADAGPFVPKPPPPPEPKETTTAESGPSESFFSQVGNRIRQFFGASSAVFPGADAKDSAGAASDGDSIGKDEKAFEALFKAAVMKRTGKPYRVQHRSRRPGESSGKTGEKTPPVSATARSRSRKRSGGRVDRVPPVRGVDGVDGVK
jgi:curved DNA-binding protein CbpA